MSLTISEPALALIYNGEFYNGIELHCSERIAKELSGLKSAAPTDVVAIAKHQEAIRQLEKLQGLRNAVENFSAEQAAKKVGNNRTT